jgi:integrase
MKTIHTEFPKQRPEGFPLKAIRGNASATIYLIHDAKGDCFRLPYQEAGKRKFHRFPDYDGVRAKGNEMLEQVASGNMDAIALTNADKLIYETALDILRPLGVRLDTAVHQYADAVKILGADMVVAAAHEYLDRHLNKVKHCLVPKAVEDFIADQERREQADRLSAVHVRRQAARLRAFAQSIAIKVASVKAEDIDRFLDGLKKKDKAAVGARTRDNWADTIVGFFEWAKLKRYTPDDYDELGRITRLDSDRDGLIEIYTPAEIQTLLEKAKSKADRDLIPFLSIGAFAGLRTSEFLKLDWADVRISNGNPHIIVQKGKRKQRGKSRRIVPMAANLKTWLHPEAQRGGPVWGQSEPQLYKRLQELAAKAGVSWKSNALRHSFVSYRMALVKDETQVALEAGNSAQMIFSNYRELVTEQDAQQWFSIAPAPQRSRKIVSLADHAKRASKASAHPQTVAASAQP